MKPAKTPRPGLTGPQMYVFPGLMTGMPLTVWTKLLFRNGFAIDPLFWPRAGAGTLCSIGASVGYAVERLLFGRKIDATQVPPPVFILGFWRSGTTHLHNLMATDPRFAYATTFNVFAPHLVFRSGRIAQFLNKLVGPKTRPMDNMSLDVSSPQEDEFALAALSAYSPYMGLMFPRVAEEYAKYITFRGVPDSHAKRWQREVMQYYKKLTLRNGGKPLILKSPPHTGRVRLLHELFPDARFVHIHRNPFEVFQSNLKLVGSLVPFFQLQRVTPDLDARLYDGIVDNYRLTYDAFFEDVKKLAPNRYHELAFEDLVKDPVGQVRTIYERMELPDFGQALPALQAYVDSVKDYKKNKFKPMEEGLRERLAREWYRSFEAWGYPTRPRPPAPKPAAAPARELVGAGA